MITNEKELHHQFTIKRFRDGDTVEGFITCRCCGASKADVVRLSHVESWEPKGNDSARAAETASKLTSRFKGEAGILDKVNIRRDRYGRIVADVLIDGISLQTAIVAMGLAWWGVGKPNPGIVMLPD